MASGEGSSLYSGHPNLHFQSHSFSAMLGKLLDHPDLSVLVSKMGITIAPASWGCVWKGRSTGLVHRQVNAGCDFGLLTITRAVSST